MTSLPGFSSRDTAQPPSRRELQERDREYRALAVWYETGDEGEVRKALKLRSKHEARILVNRGASRFDEERVSNLAMIRSRQMMDLERVRNGHIGAASSGDVPASHVIFKQQEREAKLAGSDARPDVEVNVGTFVITAGANPEQLKAIPDGATVIEARLPDEREDVIEGEVVEEEKE